MLHPEEAEFILLQGTDNIGNGSEGVYQLSYDYEACGEVKLELHDLLTSAARCRLPMHCLNPDRVAVKPDGKLQFMQGSLAAHYKRYLEKEGQDSKGYITIYGKPTKAAYDYCLSEFKKCGISRDRVLMIGDSLEHDIMGAENGGIDSLLIVATGVHKFSTMACSNVVKAWSATIYAVSAGLAMLSMRQRKSLVGLTVSILASACTAVASMSLFGIPEDKDPIPPESRVMSTSKLRKLCDRFRSRPTFVAKLFEW